MLAMAPGRTCGAVLKCAPRGLDGPHVRPYGRIDRRGMPHSRSHRRHAAAPGLSSGARQARMTENHDSTGTLDARKVWGVLWSRRLLILLCLVVAGGSAFAYSATRQKEYTASASLLFRDARLDQTLFGSTYFTNEDPTRDAATNVKLVSLEGVAARTAKALHNGMTPGQIQSEVQVQQQGQANVVSIHATDPNRELAGRIPNTFAEQYIAVRRDADRAKVRAALRLVQRQTDAPTA